MKLFPYQITGGDFLHSRKRALLADTMGLGKSAQAIIAADKRKALRILVLCPAAVRINWQREFVKFGVDRSFSLIMTGKDRPLSVGVTICSYDLATTPAMLKRLMALEYDVLILDEAHFLKNRAAKRTIAVLGTHCKGENGIISRAEYCWALTGTPTPNNPGEIYSLLRAFGVWKKNYFDFEARFCVTKDNGFGPVIVGMKNVDELKALVQPMMLRRKKEDVLKDLPPITYSDVVLSPYGISNPDDIKDWETAEKSEDAANLRFLITQMQSDDPSEVAFAEMMLEKLYLPTLRRLTGMAKIRPIYELVSRELDSGLDKIVIFGIHRDVLMGLRDLLSRYGAVLVFGGNDAATKQERIDKFVNIYKHRVFIGQIQSAGTGIDGLQTTCSNVLFAESSWNPADNAQAAMRVHRIGQKNPVLCRFASLADSLDEAVQSTIRRKTEMVKQLLD